MNTDTFISFINRFSEYDPILVESIKKGYNILFENMYNTNQIQSIAKGIQYDEFVKKTDGMDILYHGDDSYNLNNMTFFTDYCNHAYEYGNYVNGIIVSFSPNTILYFDDNEFNELRKYYSNFSIQDLKQNSIANSLISNGILNKNNLMSAIKFIKGNKSYESIQGNPSINDSLIPFMLYYASAKGKNIISFIGSDYSEYGGQNEFVVNDVSIYPTLREIWEDVNSNTSLNESKNNSLNIEYRINHIDNISGQNDWNVIATINGNIIGVIDFTTYNDDVAIKMIEISDEFKRKGIATNLVKLIQKEYPTTEIDFGMLTDDGGMLLRKLRESNILYVDQHKKNRVNHLIALYEKLKNIKSDIVANPESTQNYGDILNRISDLAYDAEQESISLDRYDIASKFKTINEAYDDVSLDSIKKHKKLSDYSNYDTKKVIGDHVYLHFKRDDDWYLWGDLLVFDGNDETEIARSSYAKLNKDSPMKGMIDVRPDKRRLGIASNIYQWIEELTGDKLYPDTPHTKSAQALWSNPNRTFGFDK